MKKIMAQSFPTRSPEGSERELNPGQPEKFTLEPTQSLQLFTAGGKYIATISPTSSGIVIKGEENKSIELDNLIGFKLGKRNLSAEFFGKNSQFVSRDHVEILITRISSGKIEITLTDLNSSNGTICREIDITPRVSQVSAWPVLVPQQSTNQQIQQVTNPNVVHSAPIIVAGGAEGVAESPNGKNKGITSRGKRENNEDGFLVADNGVAVGDGMGGYVGGAVASQAALKRAEVTLKNGLISDLFNDACDQIAYLQQQHPHLRGMGTTLALARKTPLSKGMAQYEMVHVGDSKIIAFSIKQRTIVEESLDQSYVQKEITDKKRKPIERYTCEYNSWITNSVSAKGLSQPPGYKKRDWEDGDLIVVVYSDGIADYVSEEEAKELYFRLYDEDPQTASARYPEELHNLALSRQKRKDGFDITIKNKITDQLETHHIVIEGDHGDNATAALLE